MFSITTCILVAVILTGVDAILKILYTSTDSSSQEVFSTAMSAWQWTDIIPSQGLVWSPCFEYLQCARLEVPLDWLDLSDERRAVIAVIKLPASDHENYKGPLFVNPGGPGGSGVSTVKRSGKFLQQIIGTNHDIISFDPRGVGHTTPSVKCFPSAQSGKIWSLQDVGVVDSHPGVVYDAFARSSALSSICITGMGTNQTSEYGPLSFVSTTSVARDMLEILNKSGHDKLRYWGFSYGTYLGGVFASMYPDKVDRLVSDGNVDYTEWSKCSHINFLHDTDKIMDSFYHFCHLAGPSKCTAYSSTPAAIEARLSNVLQTLKTHPIITPPTLPTDLPQIISYSTLKRFISTSLYQPINFFPSLANALVALEKGNGTLLLDISSELYGDSQFSCDCSPDGGSIYSISEDDAFRAIMCSDGGLMTDTPKEFAQYAADLQESSKAAGAVNVLFRIACAGWKVKAKWRFTGPFGGSTTFPILYIANKLDNVTPLRSAQQNSDKFNNSVILVQDSYGHTSLAAPSMCTARYIRNYFQDGVLPVQGTVCKGDVYPFDGLEDVVRAERKNAEMWDAIVGLIRNMDLGPVARL